MLISIIVRSIGAYADSIETGDAFRAALMERDIVPRRVARAAARMGKNFRLDFTIVRFGRKGSFNTIKTATAVVEDVLGGNYLNTARTRGGHARLWVGAVRRAFRKNVSDVSARRSANR
jgi:hypothetical protein